MTFYLKYRPQTLDDLDSESVRSSLKKIVASLSFPHAFLFSGVRGTGKTSAARIIAKVINCEQAKIAGEVCNHCDQCISITKGSNIDVIEIDAASHRGIDDVRALRDAVKLSPAKARKKVYIIDEAHMLTTEASYALLKTLEEPPEHVIFILCTTNPEKLIDTIHSRVVEIVFTKATNEEILRSLKKIVKAEKLKCDDNTLEYLVGTANGSYRDAVKNLETTVAFGIEKIKKSERQRELLEFIAVDDVRSAILLIEEVASEGGSISALVDDLVAVIHKSLLAKTGVEKEDPLADFEQSFLLTLAKGLFQVREQLVSTTLEQLPLEMLVIAICKSQQPPKPEPKPEVEPQQKIEEGGEKKEIDKDVWNKILSTVRPVNSSIEALLRATEPVGFDGRVMTINVYYPFHKERLEENKNRLVLEKIISEVLSAPARINCILTRKEKVDIVREAKEIFGSV